MARTAIVTGGVTGIGAATCRALKKAGFEVAATFYGNGADAKKFNSETRIPTYEWNVGDFDACQRGVAEVVTAIGPIDILVNNTGITRDGKPHKINPLETAASLEDAAKSKKNALILLNRQGTNEYVGVALG